ncbi:ester cyclase [Photobacterium lipolyticum]|uniref:Nuclear transport factor 2 family protein n=1 Tax=Photobacterium lipolyticum TaxID=266810 RepID=A0A2T3N122_9GAMM|nr:ester cyclase [Photobacterium lipolyticum]PSW06020.1 hypothetical protein C9I89_05755 [Photobacterium lipolyticum]
MNENDRVSYWFHEVLAKANGNVLAECATDPFNFHLSGGRCLALSHQDYLSYLVIWNKRFKNVQFTINQIINDEQKTVAVYKCNATYHGGWLKIPGKNQKVTMTGMLLFKMKDGLMTDCWLEDSSFDLYQQLTRYLE